MPFQLISRIEWDALPPKSSLEKMTHPLNYISVSYVTTDAKINPMESVKHLQKRDMFKGMDDIQSNFYIADTGLVFEGRGWLVQPGNQKDYPDKKGKFLEITYLGDFSQENMKHPAWVSTGVLLDIGVKHGFLLKTAVFLTDGVSLEETALDPPTFPPNKMPEIDM